jgi:polyhydroxybutyrate depolymerase
MMKSATGLLGAIALLALLPLCVTGCAQSRMTPPDLPLHTLQFDGMERSYYLHLPATGKSTARPPLVLVLHGGGKGDGRAPARYLGFTALADRHGFIVVYPNGIDARWNDGRGFTHSGKSDTRIDDVGFISKLIDHLVHTYAADASRVYVTGISNGGMMTLRLGCEISPKLAAIAPIAANIPKNILPGCHPAMPLPVLVMNGTGDPLVPWNGGYVHFFNRTMGEVVSTAQTVSFWVQHNHCRTTPAVSQLPDRDSADHSTVTVSTYNCPSKESDVVLYAINGGGHTLPGSNVPDRPHLLGHRNNDLDGAAVIWEFFRSYSR